ncbi:unnamed protein product, partial [Ixodes pacificus]
PSDAAARGFPRPASSGAANGNGAGTPPNCPLAESPVFKRAASIARSQNTSTAAAHCPEHRSPSGPHSDDTYCGPPPPPPPSCPPPQPRGPRGVFALPSRLV